jgi:hypothetical protein
MSKVSVKGMMAGAFVEVVTSVALGIPFSLYTLSQIDPGHRLPTSQLSAAANLAIHAHPAIRAAEMLTSLLAAVFGGYMGALFAKHDEVLNGTLATWLAVVLGCFTLILDKSPDPFAVTVLLLLATPLCGMLGGYLRSRRKQAQALAQSQTA